MILLLERRENNMRIVRTWCENTKEGEEYLRYNGYEDAKRIANTNFYICKCIGNKLDDVLVIKSLFDLT